MSPWEVLAYGIVILVLVIALVLVILAILRYARKRKAMVALDMDHVSLYFDEYFPVMVKNFDLLTTSRFNDWAASISKRLKSVGSNVSAVKSFRKSFNPRLEKLEGRVDKLEEIS